MERDPALLFFSFSSSIFQLTRSRGAWLAIPKLSVPAIRISTHTLTWSVTRCILPYVIPPKISTHTLTWSVTSWIPGKTHWQEQFQLTRSRGAWLFYSASLQTILHFNSHAHVERDRLTTPKNSVTIISTHTLTWSVTTWEKKEAWHKIFQLTRSRGAWLRCTSLSDLHELFQLTRSRGAWHY